MSRTIDLFIPTPDIRERFDTTVRAPADLVSDIARRFDIQSILLVRLIFWARAKLLRARNEPRPRRGLVEDTLGMGWVLLADTPGRELVAGAATQPWVPDVAFTSIPPDRFLAYAEPDRVKIAWTLETEPIDATRTRLATETRVVATDQSARAKFRGYWRRFGAGIVLIRLLLLPAVRRQAERAYRAAR
jgi:hypothetical protein